MSVLTQFYGGGGGGTLAGASTALLSNPNPALYSDSNATLSVNLQAQTNSNSGRCQFRASGAWRDIEMFVPVVDGGSTSGGTYRFASFILQGFAKIKNAGFITRENSKGSDMSISPDVVTSPLTTIEGLYYNTAQGSTAVNDPIALSVNNHPSLTSLTDFHFVFNNNLSSALVINITFLSCALNQASVDLIFNSLAAAWQNRVGSGGGISPTSTINLSGGTSAAPSSASSAARSTLTTIGFVITTN